MKEWWEKQLRVGILPSENTAVLNIGVDGVGEVIVGNKEVKAEIAEELAEKNFKEINLKDIENVVEEGDILKVKLKDGTEISYKKADLSVDELKKLEDSKLIEGGAEAVERAIAKGTPKTWEEFLAVNSGRTVEEVSNSYIKLIAGQSPWSENFVPQQKILKPGDTLYLKGQLDHK